MSRLLLVVVATSTVAIGCVDNNNAAVDAIFASWDTPGSPGCALAMSQDGSVVYSRGYGYANLDHNVPITPKTVFDVASITKQFVAASISMMALEGRLSFDDDVRKWLPELPEYESPITLSQLLYHTSGLRDYLSLFPLAGRDDYFPISLTQISEMMARQKALNFEPGERYLYSNSAYMLLALVVERVSGESLADYVEKRIFAPLGMHNSLMYDDLGQVIPQRAIGYVRDDSGQVRITHNYNFDIPGDGQMYTTVEDLLRWDDFLHGANQPEIYSSMLMQGILNDGSKIPRGKGLFLGEYRGLQTIYHTGSSWGFRSVLQRFVDYDFAIAIACNDDNAYPEGLAFEIADLYLADHLAEKVSDGKDEANATELDLRSVRPALTREELERYVGSFYSVELDATYRFSAADSGLVLRIEQEAPLQVAPSAVDQFEFAFQPQGWSDPSVVRLMFARNPAGDVTGFSLDSGFETGIIFERYP